MNSVVRIARFIIFPFEPFGVWYRTLGPLARKRVKVALIAAECVVISLIIFMLVTWKD